MLQSKTIAKVLGISTLFISGLFVGTDNQQAFLAWEGVNVYDTESGFLSEDEYAVIDGVYWYRDSENNEATSTQKKVTAGKTEVQFIKNTNLAFYRDKAGNEYVEDITLEEYRSMGVRGGKMKSKILPDPTLGGFITPADAAITIFDESSGFSGSNVASISFSHDTGVTSNDRAIVLTVTHQRSTTPTATIGGNSMTLSANAPNSRSNIFTYLPEGVLTGGQTIVISVANSVIYGYAYTLYDTDTTSLVQDTDSDENTGTTPTISLATTDGGYAFDAVYHEDNDGLTGAGTDQVEDFNANPNSNQSRGHSKKPADSTTEAMTWTGDSDVYFYSGLSIRPAAVAAARRIIRTTGG